MKNAQNAPRLQMFDQRGSLFWTGQQQVIHVVGLVAMWRNDWRADGTFTSPIAKLAVVVFPDAAPLSLNLLPDF